MREDYSSRVVENPVGRIDRLGFVGSMLVCDETCVHALVNGLTDEVVLLYEPTKNEIEKNIYPDEQLVLKGRFRLAQDRQCPSKRDSTYVTYLQHHGLFFPCIVAEEQAGTELVNMIIIRSGRSVERPYGPRATVAIRHTATGDAEILRWEWGTYEYSNKKVGDRFTEKDFAVALTGIMDDRFEQLRASSLENALALVYSGYQKFPELIDDAAFRYLMSVHFHEQDYYSRRNNLSADDRTKLEAMARQACYVNTPSDSRNDCIARYLRAMANIFGADIVKSLESGIRG